MSEQRTNDSTDNTVTPTPEQEVVARFEATKIVTAVAERVLLNKYERQIVLQGCFLALQTLKTDYERLTAEKEDLNENLSSEDPDNINTSV
tara:strand:- start:774 stop:1046 length:273 start_codon:yes stop_codon:yes gene_type:complete